MKMKLAALALAFAAALPAHAALTNNAADIGNPLLVDFEAYDGFFTNGPEEVAPGVIFTGDADSQLGGFIANLGNNGIWGLGNHFAATGNIGELRFTFAELTAGAGALVNHFAMNDFPFSVVVSAYGDNNQIIETYTLAVSTGEASLNEGLFLGITRDVADIRSISFKGNGVVLDNLAVAAPVPEPETYALLLAGLGLIGMAARRRA